MVVGVPADLGKNVLLSGRYECLGVDLTSMTREWLLVMVDQRSSRGRLRYCRNFQTETRANVEDLAQRKAKYLRCPRTSK